MQNEIVLKYKKLYDLCHNRAPLQLQNNQPALGNLQESRPIFADDGFISKFCT